MRPGAFPGVTIEAVRAAKRSEGFRRRCGILQDNKACSSAV